MYKGSCLCGGIAFQIDGELDPVQVCHCSQCRKAQGTAFVTNIPVLTSAFHLLSGDELLSTFESSPGKERVFCRVCGSPIYSKHVKVPGVYRVRAGLIDGELKTKPIFHIYFNSRANWFDVNDDLPKFPEAYVQVKKS